CSQRFALFDLIAEAFINQNVGINRDSKAEDQTGDTWKREHAVEHPERANHHDAIDEKSDVRDQPDQAVIDEHENDDQREAGNAGIDSALNRVAAETGRNLPFFFDFHRRLQRILQNARQTTSLLLAKTPCDHGVAAIDCSLDLWRGLDDAVKHDRKTMADMRRRYVAKFFGAFTVEPKLNRPTFVSVVGVRFGNAVTG